MVQAYLGIKPKRKAAEAEPQPDIMHMLAAFPGASEKPSI
jgi:hypothetical protein